MHPDASTAYTLHGRYRTPKHEARPAPCTDQGPRSRGLDRKGTDLTRPASPRTLRSIHQNRAPTMNTTQDRAHKDTFPSEQARKRGCRAQSSGRSRIHIDSPSQGTKPTAHPTPQQYRPTARTSPPSQCPTPRLPHLDQHPVIGRRGQEAEELGGHREVVLRVLVRELADHVHRAAHHAVVRVFESFLDPIESQPQPLRILDEELVPAQRETTAATQTPRHMQGPCDACLSVPAIQQHRLRTPSSSQTPCIEAQTQTSHAESVSNPVSRLKSA